MFEKGYWLLSLNGRIRREGEEEEEEEEEEGEEEEEDSCVWDCL